MCYGFSRSQRMSLIRPRRAFVLLARSPFNPPRSPIKNTLEGISSRLTKIALQANLSLSNIALLPRPHCVYKSFDNPRKAPGERLPET